MILCGKSLINGPCSSQPCLMKPEGIVFGCRMRGLQVFRLADMTRSGDLDLEEPPSETATGYFSKQNPVERVANICPNHSCFFLGRTVATACWSQEFISWYATFSFSEELLYFCWWNGHFHPKLVLMEISSGAHTHSIVTICNVGIV